MDDSITSRKYEDFDDVLEVVGAEGRYQRFLLWAVMCPIITVQPIFTLNALFMLNQPNHWCAVPGNVNNSIPIDAWKNMTIPWYEYMQAHAKHTNVNAQQTKI